MDFSKKYGFFQKIWIFPNKIIFFRVLYFSEFFEFFDFLGIFQLKKKNYVHIPTCARQLCIGILMFTSHHVLVILIDHKHTKDHQKS